MRGSSNRAGADVSGHGPWVQDAAQGSAAQPLQGERSAIWPPPHGSSYADRAAISSMVDHRGLPVSVKRIGCGGESGWCASEPAVRGRRPGRESRQPDLVRQQLHKPLANECAETRVQLPDLALPAAKSFARIAGPQWLRFWRSVDRPDWTLADNYSARSPPVERPIDYPLIAPLLDAELIKPCGQFQIPPCTVWPIYGSKPGGFPASVMQSLWNRLAMPLLFLMAASQE